MDNIIKYLKTREGHGIMAALLVIYVSAFSIYLLQQLIVIKYPEWIALSWFVSSFMVGVAEFFVFFAAVCGYKKISSVAAVASVFVLYASTYTLINDQPWPIQIAIIIYTLFPPFLIWFLSERIDRMTKTELTPFTAPLTELTYKERPKTPTFAADKDQLIQAFQLRGQQKSYQEIADALNISKTYAHKLVLQAAKDQANSEDELKEICKSFNISFSTINGSKI